MTFDLSPARDPLRESRERCLDAIARATGVAADQLPPEVLQAIVVYGQERHDAALQLVHERHTVPAPRDPGDVSPTVPAPAPARTGAGAYHQAAPGHVDTLPRRRR